jgi:hypothetical protein
LKTAVFFKLPGISLSIKFFLFPLVIHAFFSFQAPIAAQSATSSDSSYTVFSIANETSFSLDGKLNETFWEDAPYITRFIQLDPVEGDPSTVPLKVAIGYTSGNLIIGAFVQHAKQNVQSFMSRRDRSSNSERIIVTFDTYLNQRTAYSFGVTASGVRLDYFHPSDRSYSRDYSYDPVWEASTHQQADGWGAEMRIPFSQLRFNPDSSLTFGLNINHYIPNKNEDNFWIHIPSSESGWASRFGTISGISDVDDPSQIEFLPYVAGSDLRRGEVNQENPFESRHEWDVRAGGDVKIGLSSNLVLDATINPDFGQVEADPANVNLSAFEVFYSEKRPFFNEGSNLLTGGGAGYFYSRRIGASPSYWPEVDNGYIDQPNNTTILGAAKITGTLYNNLSIGALSAVTAREYADIYYAESDSYREVKSEPRTSYNVMRMEQQFGKYGSTAGIILTAVSREYEKDSQLDRSVSRRAYSGATDGNLRFDEGRYELSYNIGFSHVYAHEDVITELQERSSRYFQRPDADYLSVDSTRNSLSGYRAGVRFAKNAGEHWTWNFGAETESPEFELNDMGRLSTSDDLSAYTNVRYHENMQSDWYQKYDIGFWGNSLWNYGGVRNGTEVGTSGSLTLKNFHRISYNNWHNFAGKSDNLTRGGPLMESVADRGVGFSYRSNSQLRRSWALGGNYYGDNYGSRTGSFWFNLSGFAGKRWEYSFGPEWRHHLGEVQYIGTMDRSTGSATFGKRYQFSSIDLTTISTSFRLNMAFTPNLSLDLYAEPFVSSGKFHDFGELKAAGSNQIISYTVVNEDQNGNLTLTDGMDTFEIENRDFVYFSFRSNIVLRYEWLPGSTLFLVWQQNRVNNYDAYNLARPRDLLETVQETGNQFFAFKISYWLPV